MTTEERRAIPTMAPGREDVIPAGAAILVEAMRRWGFDRALVSETDILDGLLWRLVGEISGGRRHRLGSPRSDPPGRVAHRANPER